MEQFQHHILWKSVYQPSYNPKLQRLELVVTRARGMGIIVDVCKHIVDVCKQ
jgi:hypothetical protein